MKPNCARKSRKGLLYLRTLVFNHTFLELCKYTTREGNEMMKKIRNQEQSAKIADSQ